jgi:Tol biopolymer transport system component
LRACSLGLVACGGSQCFSCVDSNGGSLIQITSSDGDSFTPYLSDDGSLVVFFSDGDLSPGGNTDSSIEIFVARTDGSGITQITNSLVDSGDFSFDDNQYGISGDGAYVVFTSNAATRK